MLFRSAHILWSLSTQDWLLRMSFALNHSWEWLWNNIFFKNFTLSSLKVFFFSPHYPPLLTLKTESHSASKIVQRHCSAFRDARPRLLFSHTTRENADLLTEWERIDWFSVGCRDFTQKHAAIRIYFCRYSGLPRDPPSRLHPHPPLSSSFVQPSLLPPF